MNKNRILFTLFFLVAATVFSQKKKDVLMSIAGKDISAAEFTRVYKKNLNLVQDESQKNVDGYLELFIDYKLKVAEAYAQGLSQDPNYKKEFSKYQDQLSRKYIYEDRVTEEIAREAFERGLEEVNVDHILVRSDFNDSPKDTLIAYNKMKDILERVKSGEDFNEVAAKYSEEPGSDKRKGKLGYFSAFDMVYPFESVAYKTKVGEVSEIFRTSFGYHILKVNDRRDRSAKILVSHIMITDNKDARTFDPEERIGEISALIKQGEKFEDLAKQYSDDKNSAKRGGQLTPFNKGSLRSKLFEDAAFQLSEIGEISEPFKSEFGWHIVRLDKILAKPVFEDEKERLERRVKDGNRSKLVTSAINQQIIDKYGFKKGETFIDYFLQYVSDDLFKREWKYTEIPASENKMLFEIGDKTHYYNDFAKFVVERQQKAKMSRNKRVMLNDYYAEYENNAIKDYFKLKLEDENDEYAGIISEYRDGLLIFDVMQKNVWEKARTDSTGLAGFYEKVKEGYRWKQRIEGVIVSTKNSEVAYTAKTLLEKGTSVEKIKENLNSDNKVNVLISEGIFEIGQRELPSNFKVETGVSEVIKEDENFTIVKVIDIIAPEVKSLDEVKGKIMSEYQNYLEEQWLESLRRKYEVDINKKVMKKLKRELDS